MGETLAKHSSVTKLDLKVNYSVRRWWQFADSYTVLACLVAKCEPVSQHRISVSLHHVGTLFLVDIEAVFIMGLYLFPAAGALYTPHTLHLSAQQVVNCSIVGYRCLVLRIRCMCYLRNRVIVLSATRHLQTQKCMPWLYSEEHKLTLKPATGLFYPLSTDFVEVRKLAMIERRFFETMLRIIWGFEYRWVHVNIYIRFIRTRPELQVKIRMVCHFH